MGKREPFSWAALGHVPVTCAVCKACWLNPDRVRNPEQRCIFNGPFYYERAALSLAEKGGSE